MEFTRPYLIQRLNKPLVNHPRAVECSEMSFGGGGSGIPRKTMEMLIQVFDFDYMGAAEFEFGALPRSLQPFAADKDKLVAWQFTLKPDDYEGGWDRTFKKKLTTPKVERTLYVLCRAEHRGDVENTIRTIAKDDRGIRLKEYTRLGDALDGIDHAPRGWYELDNGYFFFTDKDMFEKTCKLFGAV